MNPSDFFKSQPDEVWGGTHEVFDAELISGIARGPLDHVDDLHVAQGLASLVHEELKTFGTTNSGPKLDDPQIANAIKALRAVLRRLGIAFDSPFRDFAGFRDYWIGEGMKGEGGYAKRRRYLRELFEPVSNRLDELQLSADTGSSIRGVDGQLKNIIFACSGPKPIIVLSDAVNNVIDIVENGEHCLVYDRPLTNAGLTWSDLVAWWADRTSGSQFDLETEHDLYRASSYPSETTRPNAYSFGPTANGTAASGVSASRRFCRRSISTSTHSPEHNAANSESPTI